MKILRLLQLIILTFTAIHAGEIIQHIGNNVDPKLAVAMGVQIAARTFVNSERELCNISFMQSTASLKIKHIARTALLASTVVAIGHKPQTLFEEAAFLTLIAGTPALIKHTTSILWGEKSTAKTWLLVAGPAVLYMAATKHTVSEAALKYIVAPLLTR